MKGMGKYLKLVKKITHIRIIQKYGKCPHIYYICEINNESKRSLYRITEIGYKK